MLAALIDITENLGYPVLFILVMVESMGVPVPGETAIILAGVAANEGHLSIALVILFAALAAIVGDNIGFEIGRRGGRTLLERPGRFGGQRQRVLEIGDPFFEKHGPKAVFFGRWITGLRFWAAWLAGASEMRRSTFIVWNAAGGIGWATTVGLAAYFGGKAVEHVVSKVGLYGGIAILVVALGFVFAHRRRAHTR
ncbi:MAG TPA: DedA family protein [Solirubrobacteraceae bacterium]|jgi:membrane protein DedA with SNARE-associated domain|nr:DedA family protein [Solirubrobacteraceae bacterium]